MIVHVMGIGPRCMDWDMITDILDRPAPSGVESWANRPT